MHLLRTVLIVSSAFSVLLLCATSHPFSEPSLRCVTEYLGNYGPMTLWFCCPPAAGLTDTEQSVRPTEVMLSLSLADSSDADRLERFFDSEDEDFEILSL